MTNKTLDHRLASMTLVQLYLQQDHVHRACEMLDLLLTRNPYNGHALALKKRITPPTAVHLTATAHRSHLRLQWRNAPPPTENNLHLIVISFLPQQSTYVTSVACHTTHGACYLKCGHSPRAASACMALIQPPSPGHTLRASIKPIAVSEPIVWPAV